MATAKIRAQRVLIVNAMTMEPSTIKGLRRRRRSPHVYAILYLVDIVGETGDQCIRFPESQVSV